MKVYDVLVLVHVTLIDDITKTIEIRPHRQRKEEVPEGKEKKCQKAMNDTKAMNANGYILEGIIMNRE